MTRVSTFQKTNFNFSAKKVTKFLASPFPLLSTKKLVEKQIDQSSVNSLSQLTTV